MKSQRLVIASLIIVAVAAGTGCAEQPDQDGSSAQQVNPAIVDLPISASTVTDVHLQPAAIGWNSFVAVLIEDHGEVIGDDPLVVCHQDP